MNVKKFVGCDEFDECYGFDGFDECNECVRCDDYCWM